MKLAEILQSLVDFEILISGRVALVRRLRWVAMAWLLLVLCESLKSIIVLNSNKVKLTHHGALSCSSAACELDKSSCSRI